MLISEKKERKTIGLVSPAVISVCLYDRSNILPADFQIAKFCCCCFCVILLLYEKLIDDNRQSVKIVQQMHVYVEFSACVNTTTYLVHGHQKSSLSSRYDLLYRHVADSTVIFRVLSYLKFLFYCQYLVVNSRQVRKDSKRCQQLAISTC